MELPLTTALFAPLCASTMRQGEALEQDIKKINRPAEKFRRTILLCSGMRFDAFFTTPGWLPRASFLPR